MPKIKVTTQNFASDSITDEILSAANSNTPASVTPSAEVIRDSQGKVVAVNVNLPDGIAANDLTNAKNAINANNGVAKAAAFPAGGEVDNFDGLTPNDLLAGSGQFTDVTVGNTSVTVVPSSTDPCELRAADAADSVGAAGSAHEVRDAEIAVSKVDHKMECPYIFGAIKYGLTRIGAYKFKADIKLLSKTLSGTQYEEARVSNIFEGRQVSADLIYAPQGLNANWHLQLFNRQTFQSQTVDTGVAATSFITLEFELRDDGVFLISGGGQTLQTSIGFVPQQIVSNVRFNKRDVMTAAAAGQQASFIIDNMSYLVNSGQQ